MTPATKRLTAALLAATLALPGAAAAQTLVDATEVDSIATIAREWGTAEIKTDDIGDPMLSGEIEGTNYALFFYGCTDGAECQSVQFYTAWVNPGDVDIDLLNSWNRDKRFAKAYIDDEGDPVLEMNVNLFAGVSDTNLSDTFDWWRVLVEHFEEYIGLKPTATAPETPATHEAGTGSSSGSIVGMTGRSLKSIADWVSGQ